MNVSDTCFPQRREASPDLICKLVEGSSTFIRGVKLSIVNDVGYHSLLVCLYNVRSFSLRMQELFKFTKTIAEIRKNIIFLYFYNPVCFLIEQKLGRFGF